MEKGGSVSRENVLTKPRRNTTRHQAMVTGGRGDPGDSAPVRVVEAFSLLIVTAITQLLETMAGTALARGPSIDLAMSHLAQQMLNPFDKSSVKQGMVISLMQRVSKLLLNGSPSMLECFLEMFASSPAEPKERAIMWYFPKR